MAEMQTRGGELDASIESFMKLPVARADKDKLEQARKELMAAREGRKAIVELVAAGKKDAAYAEFLKEVQPRLSAANLIFREMATEHQKGALVASEKSNELANTSIITVGIVAAVAVILSLALGLMVVRMITRPLSEVVAGMGEMAKGNLSAAPPLVRSATRSAKWHRRWELCRLIYEHCCRAICAVGGEHGGCVGKLTTGHRSPHRRRIR